MAEEQDTQEKTEEPTGKKIEKAREEGQVLTSKEMFIFTGIFIGLIVIIFLSSFIPSYLVIWKKFFLFDNNILEAKSLINRIGLLIKYVSIIVLLIGVPMMITALITQFCMGGGIFFTVKSLAFKTEKINPISGLKRIFSIKGLMELFKSILKVGLLGGISILVIISDLPKLLYLSERDLTQAVNSYFLTFPKLTIALLLVLVIIAIIDFIYERHQHIEKLKMSIQELKDEMKETDGNPEVRKKIRQLQSEITQRASEQTAALDNVKDASVVITNPTHFAVALKYEVGSEDAPTIVALGRGLMAEQIIELANGHNVTIFQSPILARALFFTGVIGNEISEKLYSAVAAILAYVFKVNSGESVYEPDFDIPKDLHFDEYGHKINKRQEL